VSQHPSASHRLWWAGWNVAVRPDGDPLRVDCRRVGLEVTELLLLLGVQPPLTTSLLWLVVEMRRDSRGNGGLGSGDLLDG